MSTTLRRNYLLPWGAIEDRPRRTTHKRGVSDLSEFVSGQAESFLDWRYYHRCRVQEQDVYLEVAIEKGSLASVMEESVWPYCCRLNVCKGQVSATMITGMADRYQRAKAQGQGLVLLYFGDLDPSGVAIPKAIQRNLRDHHTIAVEMVRVALNPDQLQDYDLPVSPDAAKSADPNYGKWINEYDDTLPTELDALHPRDLKALLKASIEDHFDMDSFRELLAIEAQERDELKAMRLDILGYAHEQYSALFEAVAQR